VLAATGDDALRSGLDRLADDLRSGRWHRAHQDLLNQDSLDVGYRILTITLGP
jgi:hypothetical protein